MKTLITLTFAVTILFLNPGVSFSNKVTSETENYLSSLTDISFEEFADGFMLNAFQSIDDFSIYSEKSINIISCEGNSRSNATQEFNELKRWTDEVYDQYSVKENMIYIFGIITEHDPNGTIQGMQLFFRKDKNDNWKLYKIEYEGC